MHFSPTHFVLISPSDLQPDHFFIILQRLGDTTQRAAQEQSVSYQAFSDCIFFIEAYALVMCLCACGGGGVRAWGVNINTSHAASNPEPHGLVPQLLRLEERERES